jgi:hypothetical protein
MAEPTIVLYENATAPVPAVIRGPVSAAITTPFVDQEDALVTFTVAVPLEVVTSGVEALIDFTNSTIGTARISCPEWRVVGHEASADFGDEFCGDVLLQVTCALCSE